MKTQGTQVRKNFIEFLRDKELLAEEQVVGLIAEPKKMVSSKILDIVLEKSLMPEEEVYKAWAEYRNLPYIDLHFTIFDPEALAMISSEVARQNVLIPISFSPGEISIAFDNPNINIIDQLKRQTRCNILVHIAARSRILEAIEIQYSAIDLQKMAEKVDLSKYSVEMLGSREFADTTPIIEIANGIIINAIKYRASDIHLEPREDYLQIRFRVDGVMQERYRLASAIIPPLVSRYKIMANLNIAERRKPQDGRIQYNIGERQIDIRMSIVPTIHGEKIVMRLLGKSGVNLDMRKMFFSQQIYRRIEHIISAPHGSFFVTGPTGCGKTTTLYAILNAINSVERNIITIENPIEYHLPLVNQIQVNPDTGLTFPVILRSVLRQDPDVIMVGEIRDLETAKITTEAALTGHLVLATLHTNNAVAAVLRLLEIGVDAFMVAPSIIGMLSQRLVRKICSKCKEEYVANAEEMSHFGLNSTAPKIQLYRGKGCPACFGTGYLGRIAIHELVVVTNEMRELISRHTTIDEIVEIAHQNGYRSMRFDGLKKVLRGLTTLSEVLRVTTAEKDLFRD